MRLIWLLLLGMAPALPPADDTATEDTGMTTTAYPASAPPHYGTDPGVRATLTTDRQDSGRADGEPLPAGELNATVGAALDWCGYLSSHFAADDELTIGRINIDPSAGSNYGDLYGSGTSLTLSTVLTWDLALTSVGGDVEVTSSLGDVVITAGDDLILAITDDITGTIGGTVALTVTGGSWSIGAATSTAGARLYQSVQDYVIRPSTMTVVSGTDIAPSYTTTEPGPRRTSGGATTIVYEEPLDLRVATGGTWRAQFLDAYVYTSDAASSVTVALIERAISGVTVTETVIASVTNSTTGWEAVTDTIGGTSLNTARAHVWRVTASYAGAHSLGWGLISGTFDKDRVE